jgi:hypothetical protein
MSIGGNACWHLHAAGLLPLNFVVVLGVGCVPPIVLGLCSHLAALRRLTQAAGESEDRPERAATDRPQLSVQDGPGDRPETAPKAAPTRKRARPGTRPRISEDELLGAAHEADLRHRQAHDGKPITRDELRRALRVGGDKATVLLRQLRAEPAEAE